MLLSSGYMTAYHSLLKVEAVYYIYGTEVLRKLGLQDSRM
jgi:hypothetical protein